MIQGGVRLLAVFCFLQALMPLHESDFLLFGLPDWPAGKTNMFYLVFLLPTFVFGTVGVWLWRAGPRLAQVIQGDLQAPQWAESGGVEHLALLVGGIVVLADAVPRLVAHLFNIYLHISAIEQVHQPVSTATKVSLAAAVASFALGVFLILGRSGLVGVIRRARQAGRR